MDERFDRTRMLLGDEAMEKLANARVAVFGVGGVGGSCVEALARAGVGALELVDNDTVSVSNINRQIVATDETVGMSKTEAAARRIRLINPACRVTERRVFFLPENAADFDFTAFDYAADCIDTLAGKLRIALSAKEAGIPSIHAMGAGNKTDPTRFRVTDLFETAGDPLARAMRAECRRRGITRLKVVFSDEPPLTPLVSLPAPPGKRATPGSLSFVPPAAGLIMAGEIVLDLIGFRRGDR